MLKTKDRQHIIAFIFFQCQAINYAFLANAPKTKNKSNVPQKVEGQKLQITKKNNYKEEEKGEKKQKRGMKRVSLGHPKPPRRRWCTMGASRDAPAYQSRNDW